MHPLHDIVLKALKTDAEQMAEEGHEQGALLQEVEQAAAKKSLDALLELQQDFWQRASPPDFPYEEPNDWATIASCFPDPDSHAKFQGDDAELADRILAAWLGRCVGCQLGKPLEGTGEADKIKKVLTTVGSWPLTDYMNPAPDGLDLETVKDCAFFTRPRKNELAKGNFRGMAPDDDIHYALVSMTTLEKHGTDFTPEQAIETLKQLAPPSCLYASGRNMFITSLFGIKSPHTSLFNNPCRQSLGAMIRCDPWGWGAPANPALAANMAYKDAVSSQVRNGIYSGIFFSVLMADAFAQGDAVKAIDTAEQYVPPKSRFAEMIRFVKEQCAAEEDWAKVNAAIQTQPWHYAKKFNHAIPNGAIVLLGLLKGGGAFTKTLGITVMAGLDTDCTGATAGSIMGCALGTKGIPGYWLEPLNDTIRCELKGICTLKISDVAERMFRIAREHVRRAGRSG
ncbi:MAG: ADP-ribosylglycohydrolase family protein [Kiritimatiellae bacterium]|nr:ADP-ribosylglycohydrolase family protein [Kiritimatiellia bacterium]